MNAYILDKNFTCELLVHIMIYIYIYIYVKFSLFQLIAGKNYIFGVICNILTVFGTIYMCQTVPKIRVSRIVFKE